MGDHSPTVCKSGSLRVSNIQATNSQLTRCWQLMSTNIARHFPRISVSYRTFQFGESRRSVCDGKKKNDARGRKRELNIQSGALGTPTLVIVSAYPIIASGANRLCRLRHSRSCEVSDLTRIGQFFVPRIVCSKAMSAAGPRRQ